MEEKVKKDHTWSVKLKSVDEIKPFVEHVKQKKENAPTREPITIASEFLKSIDIYLGIESGKYILIDVEAEKEEEKRLSELVDIRMKKHHEKKVPEHDDDSLSQSDNIKKDVMYV